MHKLGQISDYSELAQNVSCVYSIVYDHTFYTNIHIVGFQKKSSWTEYDTKTLLNIFWWAIYNANKIEFMLYDLELFKSEG